MTPELTTAKTSALVLLSGGQDSTTCLYWARHRLPKGTAVHALNIGYGQRHQSEVVAAYEIATAFKVKSYVTVDLSILFAGSSSALIDRSREVTATGGLRDATMPEGLPTSFVPGRNLLFLAAAVTRAAAVGASYVVTGVCQTDFSGYPDCRQTFLDAMSRAIGAAWPDREAPPLLYAPLMDRTKADTVRLMLQFAREEAEETCVHVEDTDAWSALAHTVTCYHGRRPGCGECPACVLRAKGFAEAGLVDPAR